MTDKKRKGRGKGKRPAMTKQFIFFLTEDDHSKLIRLGGAKFLRSQIREKSLLQENTEPTIAL